MALSSHEGGIDRGANSDLTERSYATPFPYRRWSFDVAICFSEALLGGTGAGPGVGKNGRAVGGRLKAGDRSMKRGGHVKAATPKLGMGLKDARKVRTVQRSAAYTVSTVWCSTRR